MCDTQLSTGPLPVCIAWTKFPNIANIASLPFLPPSHKKGMHGPLYTPIGQIRHPRQVHSKDMGSQTKKEHPPPCVCPRLPATAFRFSEPLSSKLRTIIFPRSHHPQAQARGGTTRKLHTTPGVPSLKRAFSLFFSLGSFRCHRLSSSLERGVPQESWKRFKRKKLLFENFGSACHKEKEKKSQTPNA